MERKDGTTNAAEIPMAKAKLYIVEEQHIKTNDQT